MKVGGTEMTEEEKIMLEDYKDNGVMCGSSLEEVFSADLTGFTDEFNEELRKLFEKELMK
ncbi:hypothetical protein VP193E371_P0047 [Vibrio phage 193E37-1]|nr:hypothetical protein VP193E371_P0047 [Vibrio phage 193E37-1]